MRAIEKIKVSAVLGLQALSSLNVPAADAMANADGLSALQAGGYSRNLTGNSGSASTATVNRVDPRSLGVPLSYEPSKFSYSHQYRFEKLGGGSKWVYLLPPRNNQIHSIESFKLSIDGIPVENQGKVVLHTEGYDIVRYPVPADAAAKDSYAVRMDVTGVLWNGKLSSAKSNVPSWVAPPPMTDAQMEWAAKRSVYVTGDAERGLAPSEQKLRQSLSRIGVSEVAEELPTAIAQIIRGMGKGFVYKSGAGFLTEVLASLDASQDGRGVMNCNGSNQYLTSSLELLDPSNVGNELNGIVMGGNGEIHMMSAHGKAGWTRLIPTDAVLFNNQVADDSRYFSGNSALGPMLICQEGGLSVRYTDPETMAKFKAANPGGIAFVFADAGKRLGVSGGEKLSFTNTPVTDFASIRGFAAKGESDGNGSTADNSVTDINNQSNPLSELLFSRHR